MSDGVERLERIDPIDMPILKELPLLEGASERDDWYAEPIDAGDRATQPVAGRLPMHLFEQVLHLLNNERLSYKGSMSRFIRHACAELVKAHAAKDPDSPLNNWVRWDVTRRSRVMFLQRMSEFRKMMAPFEMAFKFYMDDDDPDAVARDLENIDKMIREVDDTYWQAKCARTVSMMKGIMDAVDYLAAYPQYHELMQRCLEWTE